MPSSTGPAGIGTVPEKTDLISSTRVSPPSSNKGLLSTNDADRPHRLVEPSSQTLNFATMESDTQTRDMPSLRAWATGTQSAHVDVPHEKALNLRKWVESVPSIPPPTAKLGNQSSTSDSSHRPDSTVPVPDAVESYYSVDEGNASAFSTEIITPRRSPSSPAAPRMTVGSHQPRMRPRPISPVNLIPHEDPDHAKDNRNLSHHTQNRPSDISNPQHSEFGGASLQTSRTIRGPGGSGKWWKEEPHPMFSQRWTTKKLLVS